VNKGNQMPRGMLRGCQYRVANLESKSIGVVLVTAVLLAIATFIAMTFALATEIFREKEWWEKSARARRTTLEPDEVPSPFVVVLSQQG
jgi:hypothetical protein